MRTIKEILHTADGIGDKPMRAENPCDFDDLIEAARAVVATASGNTDGMSTELQLEALRCAVGSLRDELEQLEH